MTTHHLKTWPEYFQAVRSGVKTFEARRDDRGFEVGDILVLAEWDPRTGFFSGEKEVRTITYILRGTEHVAPGYCILGLSTWVRSDRPISDTECSTCGEIGHLGLSCPEQQ